MEQHGYFLRNYSMYIDTPLVALLCIPQVVVVGGSCVDTLGGLHGLQFIDATSLTRFTFSVFRLQSHHDEDADDAEQPDPVRSILTMPVISYLPWPDAL